MTKAAGVALVARELSLTNPYLPEIGFEDVASRFFSCGLTARKSVFKGEGERPFLAPFRYTTMAGWRELTGVSDSDNSNSRHKNN